MNTQYLGKYLHDMRLKRQKDNIQEYLQEYNVNIVISESYYRAIESGKKYIKIDTALQLCDALKLDRNSFFYCLLKDLLEPDVFNALIKPKIVDYHAELVFEEMQKKLDMYSNAFRLNFIREQFNASNEMSEYLYNNIDILPIIHYVYMRETVSFDEISILVKRNNINRETEDIISIISKEGLAEVDENKKLIIKLGQDFSTSRTQAGDKLKSDFLMLETEKSLQLKANHQERVIINEDGSYIFCGIKCVNFDRNQKEYEKYISDLVACFNSSVEPLESDHSIPFFFSVIVSPRKEYDTKPYINKPINDL